jgi:hypothetical protein
MERMTQKHVDTALMLVVATFCVPVLGFAGDDDTTNNLAQKQEYIQKMDVVIVSTNQVTLGTNTMSVAAATNVIAHYRDAVDVIAIHGSIESDVSVRRTSSVIEEIAHAGVPLVFVEKDGGYARREPSGADGVRTVKIGTDQFADLCRFWNGEKNGEQTSSGPILQTTVDWDTAAKTYELKRIALGLFGERVWLIHELSQSDEKTSTIGIQLNKKW